jgi:hypothetical protein
VWFKMIDPTRALPKTLVEKQFAVLGGKPPPKMDFWSIALVHPSGIEGLIFWLLRLRYPARGFPA